MKDNETIKANCLNCDYEWDYKGVKPTDKYNVVRSCPRCRANVTIKKA